LPLWFLGWAGPRSVRKNPPQRRGAKRTALLPVGPFFLKLSPLLFCGDIALARNRVFCSVPGYSSSSLFPVSCFSSRFKQTKVRTLDTKFLPFFLIPGTSVANPRELGPGEPWRFMLTGDTYVGSSSELPPLSDERTSVATSKRRAGLFGFVPYTSCNLPLTPSSMIWNPLFPSAMTVRNFILLDSDLRDLL